MQEEIETVLEHCKHFDCIYRGTIHGYAVPYCDYIGATGECRKCKISECDKYKSGKKIQPRMTSDYYIEWEKEFYGQDADFEW